MDLKQIKQIIEIMKRSSLTEFEIEEEGLKLRICRSDENKSNVPQTAVPYPAPMPAYVQQPTEAALAPATVEKQASEEEKGIVVIKSPMVGTFYRAPSPESPVFVKEGDTVNKDTTVCIIEAMKVMNEIPAELEGDIKQALVENGDSVEYGQPLFKVKQP
ncbi:MAG: acetyl-CoA carboxylase biotin carboxyl carrier protein [Verrucomicrobia bacterium]|nr:acetyl-CoA carboxylase biotin carboxyl carrier protein [Verrucomicrobiota bacterium]